MKGAVYVALAATIGNFIQGWDNATIAGSILYMKKELDLSTSMEGLVVAMSLIGATVITFCSGAVADIVGRRPLLILSASLYFVSSLVMLWSPNVYILLLARLLDGFAIGLAVTLVPVYISETAPPEIRGTLNTLPQFTGSGGMFLSYCVLFGMSLMPSPSWRVMLGVLAIPSVFYLLFAFFYLPESPRWLVSKGRMAEAKMVLQRLRGTEDVSGELGLLFEGLGGGATVIEAPESEYHDPTIDNEKPRKSILDIMSHHGSLANLVDPVVTLFDNVHEKGTERGSMINSIFPAMGSMFSIADAHEHKEDSDEENHENPIDDEVVDDFDETLHAPLLSHITEDNLKFPGGGETISSTNIGGGWHMTYTREEKEDEDGNKTTEIRRMYVAPDGGTRSVRGSCVSVHGGDADNLQASGFLSTNAMYSKEVLDQPFVGPAVIHPSEKSGQSIWKALLEPGVKRALVVGIGIQMLQQFAGINGVLYYTPQILEEAGVEVLLSDLGISSTSASFLISALTTFLMLPCIAVAMRLMDISGRRSLLLATIPVLIASLVILVIGCTVSMSTVLHAVISTICVIVYFCTFVMAYGPIPNILCSEIFPTRVRGICIALCALVFWTCDIIVTYSLPVMLNSIGLAGIFSIYAAVCVVSWFFVYLKVPETKGMPLEVITDFFAFGSRQIEAAKAE